MDSLNLFTTDLNCDPNINLFIGDGGGLLCCYFLDFKRGDVGDLTFLFLLLLLLLWNNSQSSHIFVPVGQRNGLIGAGSLVEVVEATCVE